MDRMRAFFAGEFPADQREYVDVMRAVVEHPDADTAGLEAIPFNCFGFGLFPLGRVGDLDSPCISVWYDDPHLIYTVQLRRHRDRHILALHDVFSPEEAWAAVARCLPRLLAESERSPVGGSRVSSEWLTQISPITNFDSDRS